MLTDVAGSPVYTLSKLASAFGVNPQRTRLLAKTPCRTSSPVSDEVRRKKQRACRARWQHTLEDFENLRHLRGGFSEGHRTHAVFFYAMLLERNGFSHHQIGIAVMKLASECQPPLPTDKSNRTMNAALRNYGAAKVRNATLATKLGVTPEERHHLNRWFPPAKPNRRQRAGERRRLIVAEVEGSGQVPSHSAMSKLLAQAGCQVSPRQVGRDYLELGLRSTSHRGRPRKQTSNK
jgi:hypothetical protein